MSLLQLQKTSELPTKNNLPTRKYFIPFAQLEIFYSEEESVRGEIGKK